MNPVNPVEESVISVRGLSRRFRDKLALDNVCLEVVRGRVYGLVGANGAGKTTLIKHILGLLRAEQGSIQVFGVNPVTDPAAVLGKIGFLSEDRDLPPWMRISELLRYSQAFYPKWDTRYAEELRQQFQLDPKAHLKHLSRGELAKAGLLIALAHRPDLLVLDEPSSGLDPIVRREVLEAIVRTVAEEGRTVVFSSHLLDEIERVSDDVAMMANGRVVLHGPLTDVLESHRRLTFRFPTALPVPPRLPGALSVVGNGLEWTMLCNGAKAELLAAAQRAGAQVVNDELASLDEIFMARVTGAKSSSL